jgi:hypothetical protein
MISEQQAAVELGRKLAGLAAFEGLYTDKEIAQAITEAGCSISQQAINNYRHGRKVPSPGLIVAFVRALDLDARGTRTLLRAYLRARPEQEDFLLLWASVEGEE